MIKVKVCRGEVDIMRAEGDGYVLMTDLCCIVRAICIAFCKDIPDGKEKQSKMILTVAETLVAVEDAEKRGADLEDDENADF